MKRSQSRILDPTFHYRPSFATDLRKTFERVRREQQSHKRRPRTAPPAVSDNVLAIKTKAS